jgi:hypothetical protein
MCSNRGVCNPYAGVCLCFEDFTNINCDIYLPSDAPPLPSTDLFSIESTNTSLTHDIFSLNSTVVLSKYDSYFNISDSDTDHTKPLFVINGVGDLMMNYGGLIIGLIVC